MVLLLLPDITMAWTVKSVMDNVIEYVEIAFGAAAIVYFLWYGIMFLKSRGDPAKAQEARWSLIWGVLGVIIGLLALTIVEKIKVAFGL